MKKIKSDYQHIVVIGWISVRNCSCSVSCGRRTLIYYHVFLQWKSTWNITGVKRARVAKYKQHFTATLNTFRTLK